MDGNELTEWLSHHYPGATAARSLWLWAGGLETDMIYAETGAKQWTAILNRANELDRVSRISILREALFDYPGDEILISQLIEIAKDISEADQTIAEILVLQLMESAPDFDQDEIMAALHIIPDIAQRDEESAKPKEMYFSLLTPSLNNRFSKNDRKALRNRLSADPGLTKSSRVTAIAKGMKTLISRTRIWYQSPDDSAYTEIETDLKSVLDSVIQTEEVPPVSALDKAPPLLKKLSKLVDPSNQRMFKAAIIGLENQLDGLKQAIDNRPRSLKKIQKGLSDGLWATRPKSDDRNGNEKG